MEVTKLVQPVKPQADPDQQFDKNFKPKGAIAFFLLLILLGSIIWFSVYFLMLDRL